MPFRVHRFSRWLGPQQIGVLLMNFFHKIVEVTSNEMGR